jgi:hypothetical protein
MAWTAPRPEAEVAMPEVKHPSKQQVRAYLARRSRDPAPPPALEEIRRQLGWGILMPAEFKMATNRS